MKALTKQEIQFIDTYLKNSGIEFVDIRLELIDHIASTLEAQLTANENLTFYDAFKEYMVIHKKALLDDYEQKGADNLNELTNRFVKNILKPEVLFYVVIAVMLNYVIDFTPYLENLQWVSLAMAALSLIIFYFPIEKQVHKISLGGKMLGFIMLLFYFTIRSSGIVFLPMLLLLTYIDYNYLRKLSGLKKYLANGLVTLLMLIPSMYLYLHFEFMQTPQAETYYHFCTIIIWLVVIKTVYQLKMELYHKYKTILKIN